MRTWICFMMCRGAVMKRINLNLPTFGFVVASRAALGVGIGLLLAGRLPESRRRAAGLGLILAGAATTIPALMAVRGSLTTQPSRA
jgi:hypothetical protein